MAISYYDIKFMDKKGLNPKKTVSIKLSNFFVALHKYLYWPGGIIKAMAKGDSSETKKLCQHTRIIQY